MFGTKETEDTYTMTLVNNSKKFKFQLDAPPNKILKNCDTLATLVDDLYTTETGGIVTYSIEETQNIQKKKNFKKIFAGKFYWIPEATYHSSKFEVENGEFVKKGTEVISGIFSKIDGLAQINELDQELIIKPVELLSCLLYTSDAADE